MWLTGYMYSQTLKVEGIKWSIGFNPTFNDQMGLLAIIIFYALYIYFILY